MPKCCVSNCSSRTKRKRCTSSDSLSQDLNKITFHKIPKEKEMVWLTALGRTSWIPPKGTVVCSKHFEESAVDRSSLSSVRLRADAVPSLLIRKNEDEVKRKVETPRSQSDCNTRFLNNTEPSSPACQKQTFNVPGSFSDVIINEKVDLDKQETVYPLSKKRKLDMLEASYDDSEEKILNKKNLPPDTDREPERIDRSTSVSPARIFNSPGKREIRNFWAARVQHLQRQLRVMRQKHNQSEKRIAAMKSVLTELKSKPI